MKGEVAERAEPVVSDDEGVRIELPRGVALVEVGDREELGGENQGGRDERNRFCAAANQRPCTRAP